MTIFFIFLLCFYSFSALFLNNKKREGCPKNCYICTNIIIRQYVIEYSCHVCTNNISVRPYVTEYLGLLPTIHVSTK